MSSQRKIAIVGASGYSGEELVRILSGHPLAELVALTSRQVAGESLASVYPKFGGTKYSALKFISSEVDAIAKSGAEVAFLALPHGLAASFAAPLLEAGLRVIDLSADFRIKDFAVYEEYYGAAHSAPDLAAESVYGCPELYRDAIRDARLVAAPGCYPTSVILPLVPLLKRELIEADSICVSSMSGVTGAGRNAKPEYLFAECNESVRAYGVPKHRHLAEIEQELGSAAGRDVAISFVPHLVPINRGIHTTIYGKLSTDRTPDEVSRAFSDAYAGEAFVRLLTAGGLPDVKHVAHTNFIDIAWRHDPRTGRLIVLSAEDNLLKGAAGQAVQCLNAMCGWPEATGLL